MKIELDYTSPMSIDPTEPEFAALLFKHVKDQIGRVGPNGEFPIRTEPCRLRCVKKGPRG
jgi:hypothetical protein